MLLALKTVILAGMPCWIYPLLSRFEERLGKLAEAALVLLFRHFLITLACVFLLLGAGLLLFWEPLLAPVIPGVTVLSLSFLLEPSLRRMIRREETPDQETDTWYLENR